MDARTRGWYAAYAFEDKQQKRWICWAKNTKVKAENELLGSRITEPVALILSWGGIFLDKVQPVGSPGSEGTIPFDQIDGWREQTCGEMNTNTAGS